MQTALAELAKIKSMAPNEPSVYFLLGRLYVLWKMCALTLRHGHMGDRSAMVRHLTYAQDLDPRLAARVREALEAMPEAESDAAML